MEIRWSGEAAGAGGGIAAGLGLFHSTNPTQPSAVGKAPAPVPWGGGRALMAGGGGGGGLMERRLGGLPEEGGRRVGAGWSTPMGVVVAATIAWYQSHIGNEIGNGHQWSQNGMATYRAGFTFVVKRTLSDTDFCAQLKTVVGHCRASPSASVGGSGARLGVVRDPRAWGCPRGPRGPGPPWGRGTGRGAAPWGTATHRWPPRSPTGSAPAARGREGSDLARYVSVAQWGQRWSSEPTPL